MDKKGQIIAVDFLFALILVALALGYTFRIAEANDYTLKEEEQYMDLQRIGTASSDLLASSPDFTCEITMGGTQYFPNCTNAGKLSGATNVNLGIPTQYKFRVLLNGIRQAGELNDPSTSIGNVYAEDRNVVVGSPANIAGLNMDSGTVTLKVWKE